MKKLILIITLAIGFVSCEKRKECKQAKSDLTMYEDAYNYNKDAFEAINSEQNHESLVIARSKYYDALDKVETSCKKDKPAKLDRLIEFEVTGEQIGYMDSKVLINGDLEGTVLTSFRAKSGDEIGVYVKNWFGETTPINVKMRVDGVLVKDEGNGTQISLFFTYTIQ